MFKSANVGTIDRLFRLAVGTLLILLPYITTLELWSQPVARFGIPIVGAVLIFTALVRFCPLYRLIGASTCGR